MENRARSTLIALALAFTLSAAFGSGYSIYEQGAAASGQSGAFAARASDASAIFYNPAGIVSLDKIHIDFGASAIFLGNTTFTASENDPVRGITAGDQFDMEHNTA